MKKLLFLLIMYPLVLSCSRSYVAPANMSFNPEVVNAHWKVKKGKKTAKAVYIPCNKKGRW